LERIQQVKFWQQVDQIMEHRKETFKKAGQDPNDRRAAAVASLRKAKRDEFLENKRHLTSELSSSSASDANMTSVPSVENTTTVDPMIVVQNFLSASSLQEQLPHLRALRRLLASDAKPLQEVVSAGAVPALAALLSSGHEEAMTESVWCILNIASGGYQQVEAVLPIAPQLISFLETGHSHLAELSAWALGNMAGESLDFRSVIISQGAIPALLRWFASPSSSASLSVIRTVAWALGNMIDRTPKPDMSDFFKVDLAPYFVKYLSQAQPSEAEREILWLCAYVTSDERAQTLHFAQKDGLMQALLHSLSTHPRAALPALRSIGNLLAGPHEVTSFFLSIPGAFDLVASGMTSDSAHVRRESAWVISNVTAGTDDHAAYVASSAGVMQVMLDRFQRGEYALRAEMAMALTNLVVRPALSAYVMVQLRAIDPFVQLAKTAVDANVLHACLVAFDVLLRRVPDGKSVFQAAGGVDVLDKLVDCEHRKIAAKAENMIDEFFEDDATFSQEQ
jgi:hypothetical protein